jgi:hypothetical protein
MVGSAIFEVSEWHLTYVKSLVILDYDTREMMHRKSFIFPEIKNHQET